MRQRTLSESAEINLLDIIWEFFIMWRPLLCLMIIMGMVVTGVMYVRDDKKAKEIAARIEAQQEEISEEKLEKAQEELTPLQIGNVQYAASLGKRIAAREDYQKKSPYASLDGYNFKTLEMGVFISGKMDSNKSRKIVYSIRPALEETICEVMGIKSDYVREMYTLDHSSSNRLEQDITDSSLDIRVFVPESVNENTLISSLKTTLDKGLKKAASEGISIYESDITSGVIVSSVNNSFIDSTNYNQVQISGDRVTMEKYIADFNDDQKLLFKSITGVKSRSDLEPSEDEETEEEQAEDDLEPELVMPDPIGVMDIIKYFILGAFLGAFILGGLIMLKEVIRPTIKDGYAIGTVYGLRQLGEIREYPYTTSFGRFLHSRFVFNLRYRKSPQEYEKSMKDYIRVCFGEDIPAILSLAGDNSHLKGLEADIVSIMNLDRSELLSVIKSHSKAIIAIPSGQVKNSQFDTIMTLFGESESTPEGIIIL